MLYDVCNDLESKDKGWLFESSWLQVFTEERCERSIPSTNWAELPPDSKEDMGE